MSPAPRPRLAPELPLPAYGFVPGRFPHPVSDPRGHSYGAAVERPDSPEPDRWQACRPYLYGLDLFNHGYYWEAHEVWEGLWLACGRSGLTADFLKALIQLAAAGVKVREGIPDGVRTHARRAAELLRRTERERRQAGSCYMGLSLEGLVRFAERIADQPTTTRDPALPVEVVFDFLLHPLGECDGPRRIV